MRQHLRGLAQAHVVGQDAGQVVLAQVLQPSQALQLVRPQRQAQAGRCRHGRRAAGSAQPLGQRGQAGVALQLPRALHAGTLGLGLAQALAQRLDAMRLPVRQRQRPGRVGAALGVGEQVDHRADDRLERRRARLDALAHRAAQQDQRVVVDRRDLVRVEPARVALEQVGQQRRQVERFTFDIDAQAQQPRALLTAGLLERGQCLHARAERLGELAALLGAGVGINHEPPAIDRHAQVRKARLHHDLPAGGLQARHLLGPEVAEVRLLGQRPQIVETGGRTGRAPLQRLRRQRPQAREPQRIARVGLGPGVALQQLALVPGAAQQLRRGRTRVEQARRRRCFPAHLAGGGVRPGHARHRELRAARAKAGRRAHAEQAVATGERLQADAGAKVAGNRGQCHR